MLLVPCPYCQETRPEVEFRNSGEAWLVRPRDPTILNDAEWGNFLYGRSNTKGWLGERWRHVHGCGRFFNVVRHTVTDQIIFACKAGEPRPSPSTLAKLVAEREATPRHKSPYQSAQQSPLKSPLKTMGSKK